MVMAILDPRPICHVIHAAAKQPANHNHSQEIDQLRRPPAQGAGRSNMYVAFSLAQRKQYRPRQADNQEQSPTGDPTRPNHSAILLCHTGSLRILRDVRNVGVNRPAGMAARLGGAAIKPNPGTLETFRLGQ